MGGLPGKTAQALAKVQVRRKRRHVLRVHRGHVDRVADTPAAQHVGHGLGDLQSYAVLSLHRGSSQVGRQIQVFDGTKLMVLGQGFGLVYVQSGHGHLARAQGVRQGALLDNSPAGAIENAHAVLHLGEGGFVHHAVRFLRLRHMDGQIVGPGETFVQLHLLHLELLRSGFRQVRVVGKHLHFEGLGPLGHLGPDAPESEHHQGLPPQLRALQLLALPLALAHSHGAPDHRSGAAEHMGKSQFSRRDGVSARRVHHDHARLRGRLDVDVVHAHARSAHHLQLLRHGQYLGRHLGFAPHDYGGGVHG